MLIENLIANARFHFGPGIHRLYDSPTGVEIDYEGPSQCHGTVMVSKSGVFPKDKPIEEFARNVAAQFIYNHTILCLWRGEYRYKPDLTIYDIVRGILTSYRNGYGALTLDLIEISEGAGYLIPESIKRAIKVSLTGTYK